MPGKRCIQRIDIQTHHMDVIGIPAGGKLDTIDQLHALLFPASRADARPATESWSVNAATFTPERASSAISAGVSSSPSDAVLCMCRSIQLVAM